MNDFFEFITRLGEWYTLGAVSLLLMITLAFIKQYPALKTFLVVLLGAMITTYLLKYAIGRPRPTELISGLSYVSGHSSLSMLVYGFSAYVLSHLGLKRIIQMFIMVLAACLIAAIGYSRIYLSAHYPTDVLAGFAIGLVWLYGAILRLQIKGGK